MAAEEFLCARCAKHTTTCCQQTDIYVTPGDRDRIGAFTGRDDFYEFRGAGNPVYAEQGDDPVWRDHVFRDDGTRRVLKQQPHGDCVFLGERGCVLPLETRPLICRLYPYDYTAAGISSDAARGCPLELLMPGQRLFEALAMNLDDAQRWHQQLYQEIRQEEHQLTACLPGGT